MGKKSRRHKSTKSDNNDDTNDSTIVGKKRTPSDIVNADCRLIRSWIRKGRIDSVGFVKHVPRSAEALRNGTMDSVTFLHCLATNRVIPTAEMINCHELANLIHAIQEVEAGEDNIRNRCWECNVICDGKKKCPGCTVAMYCDRPCQVKAWRGGHCNSCSILKSSYLSYKHDVKYIETFHMARKKDDSSSLENNNEALLHDDDDDTKKNLLSSQHTMSHHDDFDEFQFDKAVDLFIACSNACIDSATGTCISTYLCDLGLEGPSFEIFYTNFRKVVNGDWWLYSHCKNDVNFVEDPSSFYDQIKTLTIVSDSEKYIHPFRIASLLLCYDHFAFFKDQGITEPADIMKDSQFCTYVNHCKESFHKAEQTTTEKGFILSTDDISATIYLEEYNALKRNFKTATSRSCKDCATLGFRKYLHKNANDIRTKLDL